jgi:hypothetical protein
MAYETKPNTGSLFINDRKNADSHPDFSGKLLVSRALIQRLLAEGQDDITIELSAWEKTTKADQIWLSLSCKEPYKKDASKNGDYSYSDRDSPDYTLLAPRQAPQPQVQTPPPTREAAFTDYIKGTAPDPWGDNGKLWITFQNSVKRCETPEQMTKLVAWIEKYPKPQPPRSQEIAQAITGLIRKFDVPIPAEPRDLSGLISKIDVEADRLNLSKEQIATICKRNFGKDSRALLSESELCGLLEVLKNWDEF